MNMQRKGADISALLFVGCRCPKSNPMKFQGSERLMCGWKQKGFEMRFFALLLICVLAFFGCADGREKATAAEISAHLKNYETLKHSDPVAARGEFYAAAYLLHKGHPKSKLWAEKLYEMVTIGRARMSELLVYEILQLEIYTDNGAPKNVLEQHQEVLKATRQRIKILKSQGKDPKEVSTKAYNFDFSPYP